MVKQFRHVLVPPAFEQQHVITRRQGTHAWWSGMRVQVVVIHASAGVATSAQAMAWCMGGSPFVCVCSHTLGIFSDPPSICGDSDLRCFIDCV